MGVLRICASLNECVEDGRVGMEMRSERNKKGIALGSAKRRSAKDECGVAAQPVPLHMPLHDTRSQHHITCLFPSHVNAYTSNPICNRQATQPHSNPSHTIPTNANAKRKADVIYIYTFAAFRARDNGYCIHNCAHPPSKHWYIDIDITSAPESYPCLMGARHMLWDPPPFAKK